MSIPDVQDLQRCGNELLSDIGKRMLRPPLDPAPEHFSAEWKIASPPDITDADSGAASIDQRISSTFEGIRAARRQVLEDYSAALQEFKSVESLVTKGTTADATLSPSQSKAERDRLGIFLLLSAILIGGATVWSFRSTFKVTDLHLILIYYVPSVGDFRV